VKLMAFVRTAPEPFTAASRAVGTGLDAKFCSNRLFKWQERKIVEKTGRGEFKRAPRFPQTAPTE
jgi:DNA-binding Lrp family transcriptional regulator